MLVSQTQGSNLDFTSSSDAWDGFFILSVLELQRKMLIIMIDTSQNCCMIK